MVSDAAQTKDEAALRKASDSLSRAVQAGDRAAAEALLRDKFMFVDTAGKVHDRAGALKHIGAGGGGGRCDCRHPALR